MTGGVSASTLAIAAVTAVAVAEATKPKIPKTPEVQAAAAPPQATKSPDEAVRRANKSATAQAAGMGGGADSTMLTGPSGVAPGVANLGKSTLLGQ